jgi:transcriptional regulator with XRE-family HTH domain
MSTRRDFGDWLAAKLDEREQSQESFAREAGVSLSSVSRWVRGISEPTLGDLWKILDVLGSLPFDEVRRRKR